VLTGPVPFCTIATPAGRRSLNAADLASGGRARMSVLQLKLGYTGPERKPARDLPSLSKDLEMRKRRWAGCFGLLCLAILLPACAGGEGVRTAPAQPTATQESTAGPESEIVFSDTGTARLFIPSLNGNQIEIRIAKPEGDGPFPALIGVAGADQSFAYQTGMITKLQEMGIVAVDFAPQGRDAAKGRIITTGRCIRMT
jgi:hypothetical protein